MARVTGDSMLPPLRDGDRLLVRHGAPRVPGILVVARFPDGTVGVKRAVERRTTRYGLAGLVAAQRQRGGGHRLAPPRTGARDADVARRWYGRDCGPHHAL